jgi:hypothetical protein
MVCKWKKKHKIIFSFISFFVPIITEYYKLRARKAVVKTIKNWIANKNNLPQHERPFEYEMWTDEYCSVAQLIAKHRYQELKDAQPIIVQISGNLHLDDPLTLALNPTLLGTHIAYVHGRDQNRINVMGKEIRNKFNKLKMSLSGLYIFDNPIYFCFKVVSILNLIEDLNTNTLRRVGLKAHFLILEQLKLTYQRQKYRYNQMYHIKSKSFDKIDAFRQQLIEFDAHKDKFTYQYCLYLTPTFPNKKLTLLNSEIEEYTSKQVM